MLGPSGFINDLYQIRGKMSSKVIRSPSRYILDIGFDVADAAVLGGLRTVGYLNALMTRISKEEADKLAAAEAEQQKEKA